MDDSKKPALFFAVDMIMSYLLGLIGFIIASVVILLVLASKDDMDEAVKKKCKMFALGGGLIGVALAALYGALRFATIF